MKTGNWLILGALAIAMAAPLSGCGDNDNEIFLDCGNGIVDGDEQCDDSNSDERDECLSNCQFATCGDGFLRTGFEECDSSNLNGQSCAGLGLGSGALLCSASCEFDTSGCGNPSATPTSVPTTQPTPTVEPTDGATPTDDGGPTPTDGGPTATPTPVVGGCNSGDTVVTELTITANGVNLTIGGVQLQLSYPQASARIPGTGGDPAVADAVELPSGLPSFNDQDTNGDLIDDRLDIAWVSSGGGVTGTFATVTFECIAGQAPPAAGAFACTVASASDDTGQDIIGAQCNVVIP